MKKIVTVIEMGTLLQTFTLIDESGNIERKLEIPIDNIPETIAYYAHENKINEIQIFGKSNYTSKIKDKVISKSQRDYGHANYTILLKEI